MLTVFILASRNDERYIKEFWKSLVMTRRTMQGIVWAQPLYVEDMVSAHAIVPVQQGPYVVIGCLSNSFLAELMESCALREIVDGAMRKIPFVISDCFWDERPCPFAKKGPLIDKSIVKAGRRIDKAMCDASMRLRETLEALKGVA